MDERERKMLGVDDNQPTQKAIEAHQRGAGDLERARKLAEQRRIKPDRVVALVKEYAELGDAFHSASKYDITVPELRSLFDELGINSVTDARKALANGLLAGMMDAIEEERADAQVQIKEEDVRRQSTLDALEAKKDSAAVEKAQVEAARFSELQEEVARKNKDDAMRFAKMQAAQLAKEQEKGRFTVPVSLVPQFKKTVLFGVAAAQRQFGGTRAEILAEVKRLMPQIDVDLIGS